MRGDVDQLQNGRVQLCSTCWYVKTLPVGYFPPILNELRCDTDTRCLSGYGQCKQRTQQLTVLQSVGGNFQKMTILQNFGCECGVLSGSPLHSFVAH
ncbi:uncharacterized protein T16H12.9-like [Branchiostoma floridae]|uniref:Uncharacterized protein T16H12.9-like n=1 Tax=Branchiostoma floridae TaxID=7739 RepID=A0A9J7MPP0_BRAFL|nr:uncharacterized protein T16H12.9-like [Branchiostoma floridae]